VNNEFVDSDVLLGEFNEMTMVGKENNLRL